MNHLFYSVLHSLKLASWGWCVLALFFLTGCPKSDSDQTSLGSAMDGMMAKERGVEFWVSQPTRISAMVQPERIGLERDSIAFQTEYMVFEDGTVRFSMFMPQGVKLGQCMRLKDDAEADCSSIYLQGSGSLVKSSFEAFDNIVRAAPASQDGYRLEHGYAPLALDKETLYLFRSRLGEKTRMEVIYTPQGDLLHADMHERYDRIWRTDFSLPDNQNRVRNYVFKQNYSAWFIRVKILDVSYDTFTAPQIGGSAGQSKQTTDRGSSRIVRQDASSPTGVEVLFNDTGEPNATPTPEESVGESSGPFFESLTE